MTHSLVFTHRICLIRLSNISKYRDRLQVEVLNRRAFRMQNINQHLSQSDLLEL